MKKELDFNDDAWRYIEEEELDDEDITLENVIREILKASDNTE